MYKVVFEDGLWWITYNDVILSELGGFCEPVSPEVIIKEIEDEV